MDELWTRFVDDMSARVTGPMKFRLLMQPIMAAIFAFRSGLNDAKLGRTPYLLSLLPGHEGRRESLRDGWQSVGKVFVVALVLDAIYQWIELNFIYPGEAVITAFLLAILPYVILRGLFGRLARRRQSVEPPLARP